MGSYLFYDIETTGLNPAFDQILQFAAIRTDHSLREIDRYSLSVRLRPDVVPSPGAFLTHGISIPESLTGSCEFKAVTQIHRWLNEPGTISIGYNSLNFDDEFLRFSFYRNLLPPYTHQYDKGCLRMDLFPMVILFWLYRPEVLDWPEINGKPSLKLEHLNAVNRLTDGRAHDALFDTETTLALARKMIEEQKMWNYLTGYFHKSTDLLRTDKIPSIFQSPSGPHRKALMISGKFGSGLSFQVPVISIGKSVPYSNQTLWLRLDTPELKETTESSVEETTWVIRKKMGEPGLLIPPNERHWGRLAVERQTLAADNIEWLRSNPELLEKIIQYHRDYRYPPIPDLDTDAALYQIGFLSPSEQKLCHQFHMASLEEQSRMVALFPNTELRELVKRILFRNFQSQLPGEFTGGFSAFMGRVNPKAGEPAMVDYRGRQRMTPAAAIAEITRIKQKEKSDHHRSEMLDHLTDYIRKQFRLG